MFAVRWFALSALLIASPAFAEGWKVESLAGDVVSTASGGESITLLSDDVVPESASVVSDRGASVKLSRRGDTIYLRGDSIIVLHPGNDSARASIEAQAGKVEISAGSEGDPPLVVSTAFFRMVASPGADFTVTSLKESANVSVSSGKVQVTDPRQPAPLSLGAGDSFREDPNAEKEAKAKAEKEAAEAAKSDPNELDKNLDKLGVKKNKRRQSDLQKNLNKEGLKMVKEGLDDLNNQETEPVEIEAPKIGILRFLFGPDAPSASIVLMALGVAFLGLGYISSAVLGSAGLGMFGNAAILLAGALAGAGLHDLAFSPKFFWDYEPAPGILTPGVFALAALIGACFGRKYLQERLDAAVEAEAAQIGRKPSPRPPAHQAKFGG